MDLSMDVDIHGSYLSNTSTWMWSVLSMDIQLDIHPLPSLALGGGLSYLSGQYGLACDSFRELEVVLPNGDIVIASPTENEDLFFADRGGGGNAYGVVTNYTIQTRPSGTFYSGNPIYLFNQTADVLKQFMTSRSTILTRKRPSLEHMRSF
jgi:hypothetical protein